MNNLVKAMMKIYTILFVVIFFFSLNGNLQLEKEATTMRPGVISPMEDLRLAGPASYEKEITQTSETKKIFENNIDSNASSAAYPHAVGATTDSLSFGMPGVFTGEFAPINMTLHSGHYFALHLFQVIGLVTGLPGR